MTPRTSITPSAPDERRRTAPATGVQNSASGQPFDVVRAQRGDTVAFARVVKGCEPDLFELAYGITRDREDARDVVQDSLAVAWHRLPELQRPRAFRAWVHQIVSRRAAVLVRDREHRQAETFAEVEGDLRYDPSGRVDALARREQLEAALATLPADLRLCWVLRDVHGLSYAEIAHAVGLPLATVRGRIVRARSRLAAMLQE